MIYNMYVYQSSADKVPTGIALGISDEDLDDYIKEVTAEGYVYELEEVE